MMMRTNTNRVSALFLCIATLASCGATGAYEQTARAPVKQVPAPTSASSAPLPAPALPAPADPTATTATPQAARLDPFDISVPGSTAKLAFVPIAADESGASAFYLATTETTWDMYDAFVFAMDRAEGELDPPDAWARPSKPYILMDRGFGHAGYPAISTSYKGASEFCKWLAHKTGKPLRLPTEAEWERACLSATSAITDVRDIAWMKDNSAVDMRLTTHPVASKSADALGLFDMLGNAAEWTTGPEGKGVARGGSFKESAADVNATARRPDDKSLNRTDPQIPRSVWWLADGGFIGFRVLCDV